MCVCVCVCVCSHSIQTDYNTFFLSLFIKIAAKEQNSHVRLHHV